jgi:ABC-type antimicrobial peptide transport system permease subunit
MRALALAVAGVIIGAAAGLAATNVLAGSLYGLSASDPATFILTALVLLAVAMAASWWPARRAMRAQRRARVSRSAKPG